MSKKIDLSRIRPGDTLDIRVTAVSDARTDQHRGTAVGVKLQSVGGLQPAVFMVQGSEIVRHVTDLRADDEVVILDDGWGRWRVLIVHGVWAGLISEPVEEGVDPVLAWRCTADLERA